MLNVKPENRLWIGIYAFTAFIMLIAVSVFAWLAWSSHEEPGVGHVAAAQPVSPSAAIPDEEYQQMAAFQAPAYSGGARSPKAFQNAMRLYSAGDYKAAIPELRRVTAADPGLSAAKFYLGVSLLLNGDHISGIQELRIIVDAGNDPYLARARFYLAKGLLAEHDLPRAQAQLEEVAKQPGDLGTQAAALLAQIKNSTGS